MITSIDEKFRYHLACCEFSQISQLIFDLYLETVKFFAEIVLLLELNANKASIRDYKSSG